jgi:hypothetical protein
MWWIAACLGALLWLLVVRIKLREKERHARREAGKEESPASSRQVFVTDGFLPVATEYLKRDNEVAAVVLLFARFAWDDKPSEVHMEVLPVRRLEGQWPELATESPWVTRTTDGKLSFDPPQAHWERLTGLEPWLDRLSEFAEGQPEVSGVRATLEDYHPYAWARRNGDVIELHVVGEPK